VGKKSKKEEEKREKDPTHPNTPTHKKMSSALLKTLEEAVSSLVTASGTEPPSSSLPTLLAQANRAETFAREGALFSRNESVDDLSTLALRFLPVPFYQYVIGKERHPIKRHHS
jgi:hypothetical protein